VPGAGHESLGGDHEGGDRGFHVCRAAAMEPAVAFLRLEGVAGPFGERPGRYHVGVAGEHQGRAGPAAVADQPEVAHLAMALGGADETRRREPVDDQLLAARIVRGGRAAPDQGFAQRPDRFGCFCHAASGDCSRLS
jgi:hypothetical protein